MAYKQEQLALESTSSLPADVSEVIRAAVTEQLQHITAMRQYGFVDTSPEAGATVYKFHVYDALTVAKEVAEGAEVSFDDAGATQSSEDFIKVAKGFKITWEADNLRMLPLRAGQSRACVQEVMQYEDNKIADKLVTDASNTFAGTDWSANTADPVKDVARAKRENFVDGYISDIMILNPTNLEELESVVVSNNWLSVTESTVKTGLLPTFAGLKLVMNNNQTLGTSTVFKSGVDGAFVTAEARRLNIRMWDDNDTETTKVAVTERVVPCVTVRDKAVCTITGL